MTETRELEPHEIKQLEAEITRLETIIGTQSANGLFHLLRKKTKGATIDSEACYKFVNEARDSLKLRTVTYTEYNHAKKSLNSGWETIDEAIHGASLWYKLRCIYAVDNIVLLVTVAIVLFLTRLWNSNLVLLKFIPIEVPIAGAMGAMLRHLWSIAPDVFDRQYAKAWFSRIFYVGFIGALLSSVTYLVYLVALIAASKPLPTGLDVQSLLISLIAGFGWDETYRGLRGFAKQTVGSLFQKSQNGSS